MSKKKAAHEQAAGLRMPFHLKPGTLVVFEGLDGTGKSTQIERLERGVYAPTTGTAMFDGDPVFAHMPSGTNELGSAVYGLTESAVEMPAMTRQLLHLACHSVEVPQTIVPALQAGQSVFLDRWWWSTVAYGWSGVREVYTKKRLMDLCRRVWFPIDEPDLICLFMSPHVEDKNNKPHVISGYDWLVQHYCDMGLDENLVLVPPGDEGQQSLFILEAMAKRGLYTNGTGEQ